MLAYLDEGGSRATDLAAQSGQHKQVIGTLVDELAELGYVERRPDPADRRAKLIVPTRKGLEQMARADAIMAEIERRHAEAVGEADYAVFKRVFALIAARQSGRDASDKAVPSRGPWVEDGGRRDGPMTEQSVLDEMRQVLDEVFRDRDEATRRDVYSRASEHIHVPARRWHG